MKTVWVTGAYGFLGRNVARSFADDGWTVVGLGRGTWTADETRQWGMSHWVGGDITPRLLEQVLERPDVVVHCAGGASVGRSQNDPEKDFADTVQTTNTLLGHLAKHVRDAALVLPSSAAVYGDFSSKRLPETAPAAPVSPYGFHKKLAEDICRDHAAKHGIKVAIIRFFSLYGPGLAKQLLFDACNKAQNGGFDFFGTGEETRDFLHITDAVRLIGLAAEHASTDCPLVNGGTGREATVRHMVESIARHWDNLPTPRFNDEVRTGDPKHLVADIAKARAWGFEPTVTLEDGLTEYVAWFKEAQA